MNKDQGVVISLIVFIVLTLAFATITYMTYNKLYKEVKPALASTQSELKNTEDSNNKLTGELKEISDLAGEDKVAVEVTTQVPYNKTLTNLNAQLINANGTIAQSVQERDAAFQAAHTAIRTAEQQKTDFAKDSETKHSEFVQGMKTNRDNYEKTTDNFNEQTKEFDQVKLEARDAIEQVNKDSEAARELANTIADVNIDLSKRIDELTNADFTEADGSVVTVDQVNYSTRLDIGVKDGVYPLLTFLVYPSNALELGGAKVKGKIQVVKSLGDHACEAKILEAENGNPIQPGDLIYTSLWKKGERMQYALDYRLQVRRNDKNREKVSDLDEIVNFIESNGGEVVAYIDDDGKVHGKIDANTFRLVMAHEPLSEVLAREAAEADANGESAFEKERREARAAELLATENAFVKSAEDNGVRQVKLADFIARSGYKLTEQTDRYFDANQRGKELKDQSTTAVSDAEAAPVYFEQKDESVYEGSAPFFTEKDLQEVKASEEPKFRPRAPKE